MNTFISYELEVSGRLWGGGLGSYTYKVEQKDLPTNLTEAAKLAVDFESIHSAEVRTITKQIEVTTKELV